MMDPTDKERLDVLAGARNRLPATLRQQAVRVEDMIGILQSPRDLQSAHAAGANPTAAEFDALVDDVHELHRRIRAVADALAIKIR